MECTGGGVSEKKFAGKRVLLPRSDRANPELVEKLKDLGAEVNEVVAYKTVRPDEQELGKAEEIVSGGRGRRVVFQSVRGAPFAGRVGRRAL